MNIMLELLKNYMVIPQPQISSIESQAEAAATKAYSAAGQKVYGAAS